MSYVAAVRSQTTILESAEYVGEKFAGPASDEVDREARFPHEALEAIAKRGRPAGLSRPDRARRTRSNARRGSRLDQRPEWVLRVHRR